MHNTSHKHGDLIAHYLLDRYLVSAVCCIACKVQSICFLDHITHIYIYIYTCMICTVSIFQKWVTETCNCFHDRTAVSWCVFEQQHVLAISNDCCHCFTIFYLYLYLLVPSGALGEHSVWSSAAASASSDDMSTVQFAEVAWDGLPPSRPWSTATSLPGSFQFMAWFGSLSAFMLVRYKM